MRPVCVGAGAVDVSEFLINNSYQMGYVCSASSVTGRIEVYVREMTMRYIEHTAGWQ